jgi:hypothetical protein
MSMIVEGLQIRRQQLRFTLGELVQVGVPDSLEGDLVGAAATGHPAVAP